MGCSMEESVSLDPYLTLDISEDTDVPTTVIMAQEVAGPMMSTKLTADTGIIISGGGTVTSHYTIVTLHTTDTLLTLRGKDSVATTSVILHPTGLLSTGPNYTPNTHMQLIEKAGKCMEEKTRCVREGIPSRQGSMQPYNEEMGT